MPILQAPLMAGFGWKELINDEGNLSLGRKDCQELGRKRKLVSQMKQVAHSTTRPAEEMGKGFLEVMDSVENDGPYHKNKKIKMIKPPNAKSKNLKLMNGFASLQSMNQVRKLGNFKDSLSLK